MEFIPSQPGKKYVRRQSKLGLRGLPYPTCQKRDDGGENVIARSVSAREGFNGTKRFSIPCRWCGQVFVVTQSGFTIRRRGRAEVEAISGTLLDMTGDEYLEEKQAS
jgi:hypothetical protein